MPERREGARRKQAHDWPKLHKLHPGSYTLPGILNTPSIGLFHAYLKTYM